MKSDRGLLIVVNFNQELEISRVLDEIAQHWARDRTIVVDDGSTDRSPEIAESKGFRVLRHGTNRGVGSAIRTGLMHGFSAPEGYGFAIIMASNGKMKPRDIPRLIAPILDDSADYVQGSRYLSGGGSHELTWFRRFAIPAVTLATSLLLRRRFTDVTCGFRAYRLELLKDARFDIQQEWLNKYELEYYIHYWACRLGYKVIEAPVTMDYSHLRKDRRSKIAPLSGWWSMMRPFVFLSLGLKK